MEKLRIKGVLISLPINEDFNKQGFNKIKIIQIHAKRTRKKHQKQGFTHQIAQ